MLVEDLICVWSEKNYILGNLTVMGEQWRPYKPLNTALTPYWRHNLELNEVCYGRFV